MNQLFEEFGVGRLTMSYTMEDYKRDFTIENLNRLTVKERLAGLPPEQLLAALSPEQRLAGLSPEQIEDVLNRLKTKPATARKKKPKRGN
jgi:hypothetical protein